MCFDALNETQRHNQSLKKLDVFKMSSTNFYTSLTLNYNIRLRKVNAELIYVKLKWRPRSMLKYKYIEVIFDSFIVKIDFKNYLIHLVYVSYRWWNTLANVHISILLVSMTYDQIYFSQKICNDNFTQIYFDNDKVKDWPVIQNE